MKILIDTHIFLWYITGDKKLKKQYFSVISDEKNDVYLSAISLWECCIKQQIGKLNLPGEAASYLSQKRELHKILPLPVNENCLTHLSSLPLIHNDPFDRILICQAVENKLGFITEDEQTKKYKLKDLDFI